MRTKKYTDKELKISNRYSSIKSRVNDLDKHWSREDFIAWYKSEEKICCYCKSTEEELTKFYEKNNSKRKATRGQTLEIERIEDKEYSRKNCKLSCYWCNNAKSDVFTYDEFLQIGLEIGKVIQSKY
ncbi:MAG: hypothetical protein COA39_000285 [Sulfurimonas sp.]|nr:hypothetical protein [Sulfurimonas sp.]